MPCHETVALEVEFVVVVVDRGTVEWVAEGLSPVLPSGFQEVVVVVVHTTDMVGDDIVSVRIDRTALVFCVDVFDHSIADPAEVLEVYVGSEHDVLERIEEITALLSFDDTILKTISVVVEMEHG